MCYAIIIGIMGMTRYLVVLNRESRLTLKCGQLVRQGLCVEIRGVGGHW